MAVRIPFEEAIAEPLLLKARFDSLSFPQRVMLKALYGVELQPRVVDQVTGFSELDYWALFQGEAEYDDLGFPKAVTQQVPYTPKVYREAWLCIGRRGGKSSAFAATIVGYEALLGGHEEYIPKGQVAVSFQICQDLRMARYSLHFVREVLESAPVLKREIQQITADRIDLRNGMCIACVPATTKSVRGFASPVAVLDEVGLWAWESDSANPDYEVYRAVGPGQMQFPHKKIVGISTPWNKAGLLWRAYEAGTEGRKLKNTVAAAEFANILVLHAPTAALQNPALHDPTAYLKAELQKDPKAFDRECLAIFQDSISGFLPAALVAAATDQGMLERPAEAAKHTYIAAIDPAFRRDAFGFTIVHPDGSQVVQDYVDRWLPEPGKPPLNPEALVDEIARVCRRYDIRVIYSDQYHLESLGQLFRQYGMEVVGVQFTAKSKSQLYGNLQSLFMQGRIRLLDAPRNAEMLKELRQLERIVTQGSQIHIEAPPGQHDDMASVICIASSQATPYLTMPEVAAEKGVPAQKRRTDHDELHDEFVRQVSARAGAMPTPSGPSDSFVPFD